MVSKKNTKLNSYARWTLSNILLSQFIYFDTESFLSIRRLNIKMLTKKNKIIHYLYLWLITNQRPHAAKFNLSWKHRPQQGLMKIKTKRQHLGLSLKKKYFFCFLYDILWEIISKQTNAEKKVFTRHKLNLKLKIHAVPLTQKTLVLQAPNSYFPNIPLTLQFRFSSANAFEKVFFLRALKLLSPEPKLKALDLFT